MTQNFVQHHQGSDAATPRNGLRVLDLCSGVGGAGMGYFLAGFDVVGVDIRPQPNYPFTFHQGDAIAYVREHGAEFDLIHASWPCQHHSALTKGTNRGREYPDLIPAGRAAMLETGKPYIIENVQGSTVRPDLTLCGEMFGLGVLRHRYFEVHGFPVLQMPHTAHRGRVAGFRHGEWFEGPYFAVYGDGGGKGTVVEWQQAMGIDWTDVRQEIAEAIPPAYTRHIAEQFLTSTTGADSTPVPASFATSPVEPLGVPKVWKAVMAAAGSRCQCTGQCSATHTKTGGRCGAEQGGYAGKNQRPIRLEAAPLDVTLSDRAAAELPAADLMAWCPACRDGARRIAQRAARTAPPQEAALW